MILYLNGKHEPVQVSESSLISGIPLYLLKSGLNTLIYDETIRDKLTKEQGIHTQLYICIPDEEQSTYYTSLDYHSPCQDIQIRDNDFDIKIQHLEGRCK